MDYSRLGTPVRGIITVLIKVIACASYSYMHDSQCPCPSGAGRGWYKLAGRIFLGAIFLIAGFAKIVGFSAASQMIGQAGIPLPALATVIAVVLEFGGAILLISGFHVRIGAWMLVVFTFLTMVIFHNPANGQMAALMFEKNLAIIGGLLYVVATGAGKYSMGKYNRAVCPLKDKGCPDCNACSTCDCKHSGEQTAHQESQQHQEHHEHHEHQNNEQHHQEHQQW